MGLSLKKLNQSKWLALIRRCPSLLVSRSVAPYAKNKTPPSTKNVMAPYANTDTAITADKSPDEEEASEAVSASKLNEPYFDALNQWVST